MVSKRKQNNRSSGWIEMIHSPEIMPLWGGAPSWRQVALVNLYLYFGCHFWLRYVPRIPSPQFSMIEFSSIRSLLLCRCTPEQATLGFPDMLPVPPSCWYGAGAFCCPSPWREVGYSGQVCYSPFILMSCCNSCAQNFFLSWRIHRRILRAGTAGGEDIATSGLRMRLWPSTMGKPFACSIIFLAFT